MQYLKREEAASLYAAYREVIGTLVGMINHLEKWVIRRKTTG
jgi:hypothetical protein